MAGTYVPPTRLVLQEQLDIINAYRATLNLAPFTIDRIQVKPPAKSIDIRMTKSVNLGQGRRVELYTCDERVRRRPGPL